MIYVIEGPDRAGKSSFIDRLRNKIANPNILTIHSSRPPSCIPKDEIAEWTVMYYKQLLENVLELSSKGYDIILDRSWISECVYGHIYRNVRIPQGLLECTFYGEEDNFTLCYLYDSAVNLIAREDGESDATNIDQKQDELDAFDRFLKSSTITNVVRIDWTVENFNKTTLDYFANKIVKSN